MGYITISDKIFAVILIIVMVIYYNYIYDQINKLRDFDVFNRKISALLVVS